MARDEAGLETIYNSHASHTSRTPLELLESLGGRLVLDDTEDVEADSLGEGTALANDDLVALLDTERGGSVDGEVAVTLLVPAVLGDASGVVSMPSW
jgi:hypothetical protein